MIPSFLFSDEISAAGCDTPHSSIRRNTAIIDIVLMMFIANRANNAAMVFSVLIASLAGFSPYIIMYARTWVWKSSPSEYLNI